MSPRPADYTRRLTDDYIVYEQGSHYFAETRQPDLESLDDSVALDLLHDLLDQFEARGTDERGTICIVDPIYFPGDFIMDVDDVSVRGTVLAAQKTWGPDGGGNRDDIPVFDRIILGNAGRLRSPYLSRLKMRNLYFYPADNLPVAFGKFDDLTFWTNTTYDSAIRFGGLSGYAYSYEHTFNDISIWDDVNQAIPDQGAIWFEYDCDGNGQIRFNSPEWKCFTSGTVFAKWDGESAPEVAFDNVNLQVPQNDTTIWKVKGDAQSSAITISGGWCEFWSGLTGNTDMEIEDGTNNEVMKVLFRFDGHHISASSTTTLMNNQTSSYLDFYDMNNQVVFDIVTKQDNLTRGTLGINDRFSVTMVNHIGNLLLPTTIKYPHNDHSAAPYSEIWWIQAGENLVRGNALYQAAGGTYFKAQSNAAGTMPATVMAMETINSGNLGCGLRRGAFRDATWTWTRGNVLYVDENTAGLINATPPVGSGEYIQPVGTAYHADILYWDPSLLMQLIP